ncbi:hypothetical protein IAD21_03837 [Abditibacteriota bacterium]|nr:hypothetical protein IAD21_03837 [Abditibacteriota bacterium]
MNKVRKVKTFSSSHQDGLEYDINAWVERTGYKIIGLSFQVG